MKRKGVKIKEIVDNKDLTEEEVMKKIDKIEDEIKREAFGKTKIKKPKHFEK